jgi:hypothetical protein
MGDLGRARARLLTYECIGQAVSARFNGRVTGRRR